MAMLIRPHLGRTRACTGWDAVTGGQDAVAELRPPDARRVHATQHRRRYSSKARSGAWGSQASAAQPTTQTAPAHLKEKLAKLATELERLKALEKQMLASPDQQISLTDPDSRSMATSGRGSGIVGYNVQVAVDTEHDLIVTHEVTNVGTDLAQLANMAFLRTGQSSRYQSRVGSTSIWRPRETA